MARQSLLRITGQQDLAGARQIFLTDGVKRADIILTNADSLALLVSLLGRRSFVAPTP